MLNGCFNQQYKLCQVVFDHTFYVVISVCTGNTTRMYCSNIKVRLQLCYIQSDSESAIMHDSIHMQTQVQGDQRSLFAPDYYCTKIAKNILNIFNNLP
jgi:hypothetical protein